MAATSAIDTNIPTSLRLAANRERNSLFCKILPVSYLESRFWELTSVSELSKANEINILRDQSEKTSKSDPVRIYDGRLRSLCLFGDVEQHTNTGEGHE